MALSNQIAAYEDCFEVFDSALADQVGVRIRFDTQGRAQFFTLRLHQARALDRKQNQRVYEKSDPKWGQSAYDRLVVRQPVADTDDHWWVYIERHGWDLEVVEKLSGVEDEAGTDARITGQNEVRRIGFSSGDEQPKGDGESSIGIQKGIRSI